MNIVSRHADDPAAARELDSYMLTGGADKKVLLCVISRTESPQLRAIVSDCDPRAFVIATDVHEALGEGFRPMN